jgi:hypothetical protein
MVRCMWRLTALALVVGVVLASCSSGEEDNQDSQNESPNPATREPPPSAAVNPLTGDPLPPLVTTSTIVELADVHFDTFSGGGSVPLSDADEELIDRLRDVIAPIYEPAYEDAESAAAWLRDGDLVIGLESGDQAYAYPHRVLNFHEIVNEQIDGVPVLVSYCPLCRSSVVFDRRLGDRTLTFGNTSALYESDMVMFDWETNSYWWQTPGLAIVGDLAGQSLTPLPSQTMTWAQWREIHSETVVLSRPDPGRIQYSRDPFTGLADFLDGGGEPFPISESAKDGRLPPSETVLGVEIGGEHRVYPVELLAGLVVQEMIGGEPVVVFGSDDGSAASAFIAHAGGEDLTFGLHDGAIRDEQTGSSWDRGGRATDGPLSGTRLEGAPSRSTFWFAYVAAYPGLELWTPAS